MATNDRVERFKAEAADLNLKTGNPSREKLLQTVGLLLMVAGIVIGLLMYSASLGADDARDIQSNIVLAVAGLAMTVAGAALFLRYALGSFLRLFLLRQLYEGQSHIDQVVEAIKTK
jgi:ABC-type sulfate transport system permease component